MTENIPKDIYSRCVILAKSYYSLLERRRETEREILLSSPPPRDGMPGHTGVGNPTAAKAERLMRRSAELDRKIKALQDAMETMPDESAREFIRKNLYGRIPIKYIVLPISERTMKRIRRTYLVQLAINLFEI